MTDETDSFAIAFDDRSTATRPEAAGPSQPALSPAQAEEVAATGSPAALPDNQLAFEDRLTSLRAGRARPEEQRRRLLQAELSRFAEGAKRLVAASAESSDLSEEEVARLRQRVLGPGTPARRAAAAYLDPNVWKGMGYVAAYLLHSQTAGVRRRLEGDYTVDDYGLDEEFLGVVLPLVRFLYHHYWRVDVSGIEHVPAEGPALLVSNHSGVLPFDGAMIAMAILSRAEAPRLARALVADWFPTLPFVSILLQKTGQVQASPHNALQLLQRNELVIVFPEGYKGVSKLFRDRYQLARFGRGGFIRIAVAAGVPIIPVAVVGAEETYPMIANASLLARLLRFPFFPITPTFPWTGPLGFVPLPSKWTIDFGKPIVLEAAGTRPAANPVTVNRLAEQVRSTIQEMLLNRLAQRRSVFLG